MNPIMKGNCSRAALAGVALTLNLMAGSLVSHADIVYNTFGAGDSHYSGSGYDIGDSSGYQVASCFTNQGVTLPLSRIVVATWLYEGPSGMLLSLVADNGGLPTGTTLETFSGTFGGVQSPDGVQSFDSVSRPLLTAGQAYWVVMACQNNTTSGIWDVTDQNYYGMVAYTDNGTSWAPEGFSWLLPALRIEAIPEPAASLFAALAVACCGLRAGAGRLRRKGATSGRG
jgi:hypothetical protein